MTAEQMDESNSKFPVGMRVLAVDDDPTCLMLLETLLRKCHYHVTTTSQAIMALKLLRENKNKFDLVISDVHMPDMDGFKLLELVGLEMDLPVIMLSAYSDTKLVMKGISHGACDYLLKPVRIEELRNIWQHVIRRKKFDTRDCSYSDKHHCENGDKGLAETRDSDQNGKLNRKRKDDNENEDEELDKNGHQKKPRVVWSVELHRKFVAAVNQLGIDKAMPKRILDLMNVEKLTRENVASHLQKYRLYLKRISCVASQQANMVAALSTADPAYLQLGSLNGIGDIHAMVGYGQFQNAAFRPSINGELDRLNAPAGLSTHGLASLGMVQFDGAQISSNLIHDKFHPTIIPRNRNGNILQGMPISLELDQLDDKGVAQFGELSNTCDNSTNFPSSNGFSDTKASIGSSSNSHLDVSYNPMMIEQCPEGIPKREVFGDQSSVTVASSSSEFPSQLADFSRCNDKWQSAGQSMVVQSDCFMLNGCFKQTPFSGFKDDASSFPMHIESNPRYANSIPLKPDELLDSRTDLNCQASSISRISGQNMNYIQQQRWDGCNQDTSPHSNLSCSSTNSSIPPCGFVGPFIQRLNQNKTIFQGNNVFNF